MRPFSKKAAVATALFIGLVIGGVGVGIYHDRYARVDNVKSESLKSVVLDRLFNDNIDRTGVLPLTPISTVGEMRTEETAKEIIYRISAPGIDRSTVKVEVDEDEVMVSGDKMEREAQEEEGMSSSSEYYQSFSRRFLVPEGIHASDVKLETKENEIVLRFPKE